MLETVLLVGVCAGVSVAAILFFIWKVMRRPVSSLYPIWKVYEKDLSQVMEISKHCDDERMAVSAIFEMRGG